MPSSAARPPREAAERNRHRVAPVEQPARRAASARAPARRRTAAHRRPWRRRCGGGCRRPTPPAPPSWRRAPPARAPRAGTRSAARPAAPAAPPARRRSAASAPARRVALPTATANTLAVSPNASDAAIVRRCCGLREQRLHREEEARLRFGMADHQTRAAAPTPRRSQPAVAAAGGGATIRRLFQPKSTTASTVTAVSLMTAVSARPGKSVRRGAIELRWRGRRPRRCAAASAGRSDAACWR